MHSVIYARRQLQALVRRQHAPALPEKWPGSTDLDSPLEKLASNLGKENHALSTFDQVERLDERQPSLELITLVGGWVLLPRILVERPHLFDGCARWAGVQVRQEVDLTRPNRCANVLEVKEDLRTSEASDKGLLSRSVCESPSLKIIENRHFLVT